MHGWFVCPTISMMNTNHASLERNSHCRNICFAFFLVRLVRTHSWHQKNLRKRIQIHVTPQLNAKVTRSHLDLQRVVFFLFTTKWTDASRNAPSAVGYWITMEPDLCPIMCQPISSHLSRARPHLCGQSTTIVKTGESEMTLALMNRRDRRLVLSVSCPQGTRNQASRRGGSVSLIRTTATHLTTAFYHLDVRSGRWLNQGVIR